MSNKWRRKKCDMRKSSTKNFLVVIFLCYVIFLFFNYYDDCTVFNMLTFMEPNRCKPIPVQVNIIQKLNVTLASMTAVSTKSALHLHSVFSTKQEKLPPDRREETGTELPLEMVFRERKEQAENSCKEMIDAALAKENERSDLNIEENQSASHFKFSVGHPDERLLHQKILYNKDLLQILRMRNKPKYFHHTPGVKKNRWIHFHRIIQSPDGPAKNRVVEVKWCPIFKAASTPWLAVFTKLSKALTNRTEAQIMHGRLGFLELAKKFRLLTPRIYEKNVNVTKYTMMIARHPFKRLLSAYRDKIERVKGRLYYYKKYSINILKKFRKSEIFEKKWTDKTSSMKVPTFQEFVHYILTTEPRKLDEHWRPIYLDCNPCLKNFDFILKVETMNEDKDKLLQYLHVMPSEVQDVWLRWNNPSGQNVPNRNESFYYSQLTTKDIQKLYELYETDFQIFNYSPDNYFLMGSD